AGDALVFAGATHCQPLVRPGLLARHCWFCPQISPSATVPRTCCKRRAVDLPQYPSAVSFAAFFDLLGFDGFGFDTGFDGFETAPEAFLASFKMPSICLIFAVPGHVFPYAFEYFIPPPNWRRPASGYFARKFPSIPRRCQESPLDDAPSFEFFAKRNGILCVSAIHATSFAIALRCFFVHFSDSGFFIPPCVSIEIVASLPSRSALARIAVSTYCSTAPSFRT